MRLAGVLFRGVRQADCRTSSWVLLALYLFAAGCQTDSPAPEPGEASPADTAQRPQTAAVDRAVSDEAWPADASSPPAATGRAKLPAGDNGYPEPLAALPLFARPVSDGWHFPSRYHYHEWRHAVGLRQLPETLPDASGRKLRLSSGTGPPRLVLLIDDLGNSAWALRQIAALPFPVNGAILPHTPLTSRAARVIRETGGDVLLHLPLEPMDYPKHNPGSGALFVTMPTEQRVATLLESWNSIPDPVGLNNHMGSRYTADAGAMADIAAALADQSPIFVDSRTVPRSKAHAQMILHGIPSLGRTHFLDEEATVEHVSLRLEQAVASAQRQGAALAIGHPNRATLRVLAESETFFDEAGVEIVSLQDLFQLER